MTRPLLPLLLVLLAATPAASSAQRNATRPQLNLVPTLAGPAPADLAITGTPTSASLTWPAVAGAMGYRVFRAVAPATAWSLLTPAPISQPRYDDAAGLDFHVQYLYRVAGVFPAGEGAIVERPFQPPSPVLPVKSAMRNLAIGTINVVQVFPNGGSVADIRFSAVPNATTYTIKRGTSANGPFADLTSPQVSWSLANYAVTPTCCEVEDHEAYKLGASTTAWYVIDAWRGPLLVASTAPIRFDLPSWFHGPLLLDVLKTGTNQWTLGWGTIGEATGYVVTLKTGDNLTIENYSGNLPATQHQVTVTGLVSGLTYQLIVSAVIPWNGTVAEVSGLKWYTVP